MANKKPMKRNALKFIYLLLLFPIYFISKLIPKDKKLYIFGSSMGHQFTDNSKYLFLYTSENRADRKSVFISKEKDIVAFIRDNGMMAEYLYSYSGFKTVIRAHKAFISHSVEDIHPVLTGGAEVIQLWHGTPIKRIGYDTDLKYDTISSRIYSNLKLLLFKLFPYLYLNTTCDKLVISSSNLLANFQSAFDKDEANILILGQPRNDCIAEDYALSEKLFPEHIYLEKLNNRYKHLIAWLPTHRLHSSITIQNLLDDYGFDIDGFSDLLDSRDAALIIKPHFIEHACIKDKFCNRDNIIVYDYSDPYPLMKYTDILITDYSSIYFDFLLLDKPILFAPFDYDDFIKNNAKLYYEYNNVTPGPICYDWPEIMKYLGEIFDVLDNGSVDMYQAERERVCKRFNDYKFANAKRVTQELFN